ERVQNVDELIFREVEKTIVVKRAAATQVLFRDTHAAACVFQYFDRRFSDLRMEIIVERIRPQDHRGSRAVFRATLVKPFAERLGCEAGNAALGRNPGKFFADGRETRDMCEQVDEAWNA